MRKEYKKLQKNINKIVRAANKTLADDPLWQGRFVIRQQNIRFIRYDDNSGYWAIVSFIFWDKKTNIQCMDRTAYYDGKRSFGWWIFTIMNDFILQVTRNEH